MSELAVNIDNALTSVKPQVIDTIRQYKWSIIPDSQLHAAKAALSKNNYIEKIACGDLDAVKSALIQSSILGLDLTEGKRQGWLLPRKNAKGNMVISLQVGYKGVEAIHQRMGVIKRLVVRAVYDADEFVWSGDDQEKPTHNADWMAPDRGKIKGAFAITYFPDDSIQVIVKSITEIYENHRDVSDSWKSYQSKLKSGEKAFPPPWVTYEEEMVNKTMAYVASKQWPANIQDDGVSSGIISTLHEVDVADYSGAFVRYTPEHKQVFYNLLGNDDPLGIYLFFRALQELPDERVFIDLIGDHYKSIPRGGKGKEKDRLKEIEDVGRELFENIIESILINDKAMFLENVDGATGLTKKALMTRLDAAQKAIVNDFFNEEVSNELR